MCGFGELRTQIPHGHPGPRVSEPNRQPAPRARAARRARGRVSNLGAQPAAALGAPARVHVAHQGWLVLVRRANAGQGFWAGVGRRQAVVAWAPAAWSRFVELIGGGSYWCAEQTRAKGFPSGWVGVRHWLFQTRRRSPCLGNQPTVIPVGAQSERGAGDCPGLGPSRGQVLRANAGGVDGRPRRRPGSPTARTAYGPDRRG